MSWGEVQKAARSAVRDGLDHGSLKELAALGGIWACSWECTQICWVHVSLAKCSCTWALHLPNQDGVCW